MRYSLLVLCAVACSNETTTSPSTAPTLGSGSASTKRGSAGGFSASLSADLAKEGSATSDPKVVAAIDAGAGSKIGGSVPAPIDAKPEPAGSAAQVVANGSATKVAPGSGSATKVEPKEIVMTPEHHGPIRPSAELAAIKFELLPNWDRDIDEAGTIVLNVKVHGGSEPRTFTFHYGYDDPRAPADRDAYKKFLGEAKLLDVKTDRQRGAAWYLEGTDGNGRAAFRYLVNYGGKHLVCYGTLYKDADSSALGDIRDEVVIQAKKICESLSL